MNYVVKLSLNEELTACFMSDQEPNSLNYYHYQNPNKTN